MKELTFVGFLWIYLGIGQIFAIINFIEICKTWDSFLGIIFFGPIVAEIKAIFWIFLIW